MRKREKKVLLFALGSFSEEKEKQRVACVRVCVCEVLHSDSASAQQRQNDAAFEECMLACVRVRTLFLVAPSDTQRRSEDPPSVQRLLTQPDLLAHLLLFGG